MRVQVTRSFEWAPNGTHVRTVKVGEVLEGRGAEVALELKCGSPIARPMRLPPIEEYVASGHTVEGYPKMLERETATAKAAGVEVEIRLPTHEETGLPRDVFEKRLIEIERVRLQLEADKKAADEKAALEQLEREEAAKAKAEENPAARAPEPAKVDEKPASDAQPTPPAAPASSKRRGR